jgi:beta-1,4-mannosyl-glycoprotein beta-1,4-N-acetylglucosaminyltransferase
LRIYDSFPFDGELDLLEHRLRETYDLIDVFVLVEAGATYQGTPKGFTFDANKERFAWASPKLRHVKLATLGSAGSSPRQRAAVQRNAAMLVMRDLQPADVVLLLDVDEIPSRECLVALRREPPLIPTRLAMTRHYQYLDLIAPASSCCPDSNEPFAFAKARITPAGWDDLAALWYGTSGVAVPGSALLGDPSGVVVADTPFRLRFAPPRSSVQRAGRHLSSVDQSTRLEHKLTRVFHTEWAGDRARQPVNLQRCRKHAVHHRGWWYAEAPAGPLPDDLARLRAVSDATARGSPLPASWRRRVVRTWAWLRLWPPWPEPVIQRIDGNFDALLPLLLLPLCVAGLLRRLCARRRFATEVQSRPVSHRHG